MFPEIQLKRLVDAARPITYGIVQAGPDEPGGVPYIRPVDMTKSNGVANYTALQRTTKDIAKAYSRSIITAGDLVVSIGPSYGKIMVVPGELSGANLTQGTARVAAAAGVYNRFLFWALQTSTARQFWDSCVGGATFRALNLEPLGRTPISMPPSGDRRRIADFLDTETGRIDALTNARSSQHQMLNEWWKSYLGASVQRLIDEYGTITLRRVVNSVEQGWSPQCDDTEAHPAEWAVLKTSAVSAGTFKPSEHKRLPVNISPEMRYKIMDGDILMTRGSGSPEHVGVAAMADTEGRSLLLSDLLYRIRVDQAHWSPQFITLALASNPIRGLVSLLFRGQSGQTIKLRSEDVKEIGIPAAPVTVQHLVSSDLMLVRNQIQNAQAAIGKSQALLAERRQALITAAVTGRFDVSSASGRGLTDGVPV